MAVGNTLAPGVMRLVSRSPSTECQIVVLPRAGEGLVESSEREVQVLRDPEIASHEDGDGQRLLLLEPGRRSTVDVQVCAELAEAFRESTLRGGECAAREDRGECEQRLGVRELSRGDAVVRVAEDQALGAGIGGACIAGVRDA